jgi:hypothetical protein
MKKLCKTKKMTTNNTSPIKVRKKNSEFYQINSVYFLKSVRLLNPLHKKILKKKDVIINTGIIIKKNLGKYNSTQTNFHKKLTNQILFNLPHKIVSVFKDNLIWNEIYDYILYFYSLNKSNELLPKLGIYYETYTLFIPIYFPLMDERDILTKYIKNKLKLLEMTKCQDDLRDECKDLERNIIDCDSNNAIRNYKESIIEDKKELISNKINKGNNEQKLINSSEIKTENSNSVSNYFGIESIIKSKETSIKSIYPENEKIENFSSILEQIKNKNKKDFDLSSELASIIQLFEENNKKKSTINNNNKTTNVINIKNSKDLKKKRKLLRIGIQNMTYRNIIKIQSKENFQKSKNSSNSIKSKRKMNYPKFKKISDKINHSSKNILTSNTCRNLNLNKLKLFSIINKSQTNSERKYYHKKANRIKDNSQIIRNNTYKSVLSAKNIKKNNIYNLIWDKKNCVSKKQNKIEIIKKMKKIYEDSKSPKSKSKKKEKDDLSKNKTSEYSLIYTSPSNNNLKSSLKNRKAIKKIRNNNKSFSEGKNLYLNKNYSHIDIKKCIVVNKKESNNYIFGKKTKKKLINTINLSFNTFNSSNKILANKMENLRKSIKMRILNTPKDKKVGKFISSNSIESKNSLNHNEIPFFIPKTVMKKMFSKKIYKGILLNKPSNNSSFKKHEFCSKYCMTYSSNNGNKSKVNINLKKNNKNNFESKIQTKNKKNTKIITKFKKFMTIAPKSLLSSSKKDSQSYLRTSSKFSVFSFNESNSHYKNRNTFFKNNIRKMKKIIPYFDRTLESNHNNNLLKNSYISNEIKLNSQTEDDKISIKSAKIKNLNNNLKLPYNNFLLNKISSKNEFKNKNKKRTIY